MGAPLRLSTNAFSLTINPPTTPQVSLNLEDSTEYEILEEAGAPGVRGKRSACIPPNDKAVLTVRIRPSEIADVNLTVSAAVDATEVTGCGAGANSPQRT